MKFYLFDLDLDPMTLALKLVLDIIKMYVNSEHEVHSFSSSKLQSEQTHRQTDTLD